MKNTWWEPITIREHYATKDIARLRHYFDITSLLASWVNPAVRVLWYLPLDKFLLDVNLRHDSDR